MRNIVKSVKKAFGGNDEQQPPPPPPRRSSDSSQSKSGVILRDMIVEEFNFMCDHCKKPIVQGEDRYQCVECSSHNLNNTFDICGGCFGVHTKLEGRHRLMAQNPELRAIMVLKTFCETLENRFAVHGVKPFLGTRIEKGGPLQYTRYDEVYVASRSLASWIIRQVQVPAEDEQQRHVAILSANNVEWVISEIATVFCGAVSVGIHTNLVTSEVEAMLAHGKIHIVLVDAANLSKVESLRGRYRIISFASQEWKDAISLSRENWEPTRPAKSKLEIRSLMYTSGSTGVPKATIVSDLDRNREFVSLAFWRPPVTFCYQPLAYATQRLIFFDMLNNGGRHIFHSGDMTTFFSEVKDAQVTSFSAPPSIWNTLYAIYKSTVDIEVLKRGEAERPQIEVCRTTLFAITFPNQFSYRNRPSEMPLDSFPAQRASAQVAHPLRSTSLIGCEVFAGYQLAIFKKDMELAKSDQSLQMGLFPRSFSFLPL